MLHRPDWSRRPLRFLAAALVAFSACVLATAGAFDPVEDVLTAKRAELLDRHPTGQVVIVEIDARSLAQLRSWPWPRKYHAEVVRRLHRADASLIAFDVDFSARSDSGDAQLGAAIREAGHVILPTFAQRASGGRSDTPILSSRPDAAFSHAWVGGVNIFPDADGLVREYPAATRIDGKVQPSIATLVAEKDELGDRSFQPDWAIDAAAIPRLSFVDVMQGRVPASALKGKRILVGATAIELGDRYTVPRYGVVPGVVVQALAAESLLQDRAIQRTGLPLTAAGIVLLALLFAPRPLHRPLSYAGLCALALVFVLAGPALVQLHWPVTVDSAAWIFTLFAVVGVQAIVEARRRLRYRAHFDAESGLPNRSVLEAALANQRAPVVVTTAIERFEAIRDGLGIAATNELIAKCGDVVGDLADGAVYRVAPDVIAWAGAADTDALIRRIQAAFREPVVTAAGPVDVALTFGLDRDEGESAPVLRLERALSAIGSARSLGKSSAWYRGAETDGRRQLSMMSELRQAMKDGRLRLAYQPKLSLTKDAIGDAEALIRWEDGNGAIVSPDEFIPLAEATGVIREVTTFALRTALADVKAWRSKGLDMRVAVNVSALDLAEAGFVDEVERALSHAGVPASQLTLEVTESALIRSQSEAVETLTRLRERGVRLAVDDYGTGQSTLSYLKHLPVHEVKIDKGFVTALATDESDAILVRSTINLAHDLGLEVVAEGIEDQQTLDALRDLGCDYAQGYFVSKPIWPDEFLKLTQYLKRAA